MTVEPTSRRKPRAPQHSDGPVMRRATDLTTLLIKIGGVFVGIYGVLQVPIDSRVLVLAALMLAGGNLSESLVLAAIDRFMDRTKGTE